jgi:hypothetical protein
MLNDYRGQSKATAVLYMLKTYFIILPLSLGRRLVGKLGHPGPGAKLNKLDLPKGLGEQVY